MHCAFKSLCRGSRVCHVQILHLVADDMRPQLGCYGHAFMKTPHLDELSATGLHFDFAYTNFAYCAPSVCSLLPLVHIHGTDFFVALWYRSETRSCQGGDPIAREH